MTDPKRLFDCLELHKKDPLPDMLSGKEKGVWKTYSTEEVIRTIQQLSTGL